MLIGLFGAMSYWLITWLGQVLLHADLWGVALGNLTLLLLPTFLMGSTLPLLTCFFNQYIENIGESIGLLYFINTMGAAFGSVLCGFILFNYLTIPQTLWLAASVNLLISCSVFILYVRKS